MRSSEVSVAKNSRTRAAPVAVLVAAFGLGCGGGENPVVPTARAVEISLTATSTTLQVQGQAGISASLRDERGRAVQRTVAWDSSNPSVVSIIADKPTTALITAVSPGSAVVSGSVNGLRAELTLVVAYPVGTLGVGFGLEQFALIPVPGTEARPVVARRRVPE